MVESKQHRVLIATTTGWISAARLVPVVRRAGCSVTAVAPRGSSLLKAGGIDHAVACDDDIDTVVHELLRLVAEAQTPYDYIQIADDPLLWHLADRRGDPRLHSILPFDPAGDVGDILTQKHCFTEGLAGTGVSVVPGSGAVTNEQALDAADRIGYPVIMKPSRGFGGGAVKMFESRPQLESHIDQYPVDRAHVVQKFVRGKVGLVEALLDHGEPRCWTTWYKARTIRGPFGGSSARELFTVPGMEEQLRAFGQATSWHGFCGLDLIHEEGTGDIYFIEVNARQTTGNLFGWCAGADFSKAFAAMLDGRGGCFPPVANRRDGLRIRSFPADINRAIYESDALSLATAPFDPAVWRDVRSQDLRLIAHGCYRIGQSAKRKIKRIFRRR